MVCEHLTEVERELLAAGARVNSRGQAWSQNCREWVYFDCYIDTERTRVQFTLAPVVQDHTHRGTHDGSEHGLVCSVCHDALMGHVEPHAGGLVFPPREARELSQLGGGRDS